MVAPTRKAQSASTQADIEKEVAKGFVDALPVLMTPIIIIGGSIGAGSPRQKHRW